MALAQARIGERRLHERLTIVEHAVDLEREDVVAPARELVLLTRRDLPFREQHGDADAAAAVERGGHRAAGVARGRDENRERTRLSPRNR